MENKGEVFKRSGEGVKWILGAGVFSQAVRFIFSLFLARLLSPEDFGLMAMAILLTEFMARFNNMGLSAALIQKNEVEEKDFSTTFWFLVAVGIMLCGATVLASPLVELFFRQKGLAQLIRINAIGLLIMPVGSLYTAILMRNLNFRAVGIAMIISSLGPGLVSIALAYRGFGVLSLAYGGICHVIIFSFVKFVFCGWTPSFSFQVHRLKKYYKYGTRFLGTLLLDFSRDNLDNLAIGKYLGGHSLGIYGMAFNISSVPSGRLFPNIQNMAFPAMARLQDRPEAFTQYYLSFSKYLSICVFPLLFGLYCVSGDLISVAIGNRWLEVVPPMKIMCIAMILEVPIFCGKTALMARGFMSHLFKMTVFQSIFLVLVIYLGVQYGVIGVAYAIAIQLVIVFITSQALLIGLLKISFGLLVRSYIPSILSSFVLVSTVTIFQRHFGDYAIPQVTRLVITIAVGVGSYIGTIIIFYRKMYDDAMIFLREGANNPREVVV